MESPLLGKEVVEGLYAAAAFEVPYEDTAKGKVKDWLANYKKGFNTDANTQAVIGYNVVAEPNGLSALKRLEEIVPRVIREVRPQYTSEAMRAKVQGTVLLECVVRPDGSVGDVTVVRSLDPTFGLDQEAIKAAKNWRFQPGMRMGEAVAVLVTIELTFTLR